MSQYDSVFIEILCGKDIGKGTSSDTSATDERDACRGDPRDHTSREKPGRDFAASYVELDDMSRLWVGANTDSGGEDSGASPEAITEPERAQLKREGMLGGKVDDVTIVIGLLHETIEGTSDDSAECATCE